MILKILSVSDKKYHLIHSPEIKNRFPDVDLILGCGDLPYYYLEYISETLRKPLYFVRGNHDHLEEFHRGGVRRLPKGGFDLQLIFDGKFGPIKARNEMEFLEKISSCSLVLMSDLTAIFPNGTYLASKWIQKGVLESGTMAVYRNPAGEFVSPSPAPVELYEQQETSLNRLRNYLIKGFYSNNN